MRWEIFGKMLEAVSTSTAMLYYLDNNVPPVGTENRGFHFG